MHFTLVLRCLLPMLIVSSPTLAHDVVSLGPGTWTGARATFPPSGVRIQERAAPGSSGSLFSIWEIAKRWTPGSTVDVCFFAGSETLRKKIAQYALEWTQYGNIKFDFGSPLTRSCDLQHPSPIRVGFAEPGDWSYVGTESLDRRILAIASLNLEAYDTNPPEEARIKATVLHEFGHALGFDHEHQAPSAGCDTEIDWNYAYAWLGQRGWTAQMVKDNLGTLDISSGAFAGPALTGVDRLSIMHYSLPPDLFIKRTQSKCWIPNNDDLSDIDKKGMASAYPKDPAELRATLEIDNAVLDAASKMKNLPPEIATAVKARRGPTSNVLRGLPPSQ